MINPFGRGRRRREELLGALRNGQPVDLDCRLRRTSARGWGPWTPATVSVGAPPDGPATWHVEDPVAVGLPAVHGPVDASLADDGSVWVRPVRFQTEAFWGMEGLIVVVESERSTVELAVEQDLTSLLADRLEDLLSG